ncbi:MAG: glutamate 5-kinase [Patescibacteria group bacterium]
MFHRVVVKIGSSITVQEQTPQGGTWLQNMCHAIGEVQRSGCGVLVVLSGAVATGRGEGLLTVKQAQAARGQWLLNARFERAAAEEGLRCALLLLGRQEFVHRNRYAALRETVAALLDNGHIVVVNENDAILPQEGSGFPDNDHLASILAISIGAERLLLMTNVDGIFSDNPNRGGHVELLEEITNVNAPLLEIARGEHSTLGRGGMVGKLKATRLATAAGIPVHIFNGVHPEYLSDIVLRGKRHGTFCPPRSRSFVTLTERERWLLSSHNTASSIQIDAGAARALRNRKSLLAVGVHALFGRFAEREVVEIVDLQRETVAAGLTSVDSKILEPLIKDGGNSRGIKVVHADNLIIFTP